MNTKIEITTGAGGCSHYIERLDRYCQQRYLVWRDGRPYCFYHDPLFPHKFGERAKVTRSVQEQSQS